MLLIGEGIYLTFLLFVPQQDRLPKKQRNKETHNEFIECCNVISMFQR